MVEISTQDKKYMPKNIQFFSSFCLIGKSFANSTVKNLNSVASQNGIGRWIIARHGQSEFNIGNFWAGWHDTPLTEKGVEQARSLGAMLQENKIFPDLVITTDLTRAVKTTEITFKNFEIDPSLRELHPGALVGTMKDSVNKQFIKKWNERPEPMTPNHPFHPNNNIATLGVPEHGSESMYDVSQRTMALMQRVVALVKDGKTVLTIGHNNSLSAMVSNVSGENKKTPLKNAAPYEGIFYVKNGEVVFAGLLEMTVDPLINFIQASMLVEQQKNTPPPPQLHSSQAELLSPPMAPLEIRNK